MSEFNFLNESKKNLSPGTKIFVKKSFDILDRIHELMREKGITQKELAQKLGKKEPEISKWINGVQNFTLKTISKLEWALDDDIIGVATNVNTEKSLYPKATIYLNYSMQEKVSYANEPFENFENNRIITIKKTLDRSIHNQEYSNKVEEIYIKKSEIKWLEVKRLSTKINNEIIGI